MDEMKIIKAPWTQEQVRLLTERQHDITQHPYTCLLSHVLLPTTFGWVCLNDNCVDYKQDWALMCAEKENKNV